jgi:hypothetical protein
MKNINNFNSFSVNEATIKGNIGFPGEDPEKPSDSFIDAVISANREEADRIQREQGEDVFNLMGNARKAMRLQAGKEKELSDLAEEIISEVYGSFIDDVVLDLKITTRPQQEMKDKMEPCTDCEKKVDLEDQEIIDEINKRKIFRTIQQGKGLNVKEIINLPKVAKRLKQILGDTVGEEYRILANKIATGAHFFDLTLTPDQKQSMFRQAPPGACDIQITKYNPESKEEFDIDEILNDIEQGKIDDEVDEAMEGVESRVIARATDFGLLIHESVKGIYKLITQVLLMGVGEDLGIEAADLVKDNTETFFDEIEEQAIGKTLQKILGIIINSNARVGEILFNINSAADDRSLTPEQRAAAEDEAVNNSAYFIEQLHFLVYGKLATIKPARECLEFFHSILEQSIDPETKRLKSREQLMRIPDRSKIDPIINQTLDDMDAEKEYQDYIKKYGKPKKPDGNQGGGSSMPGFDAFGLN